MSDLRFIFQIDYNTEQDSGIVEESNIDIYAISTPEIYKYRYDGDVYLLISGGLKLQNNSEPIHMFLVHFIGTDEKYNLFLNKLLDTNTIGVCATPDMLTYPDSDSDFPTIKKETTFIIPRPKYARRDYIEDMAEMLGKTTGQEKV